MSMLVVVRSDADAIEIGNLYRKARTSMVDSLRYLIEAGHRLIAKQDSLAHGEWLPWLEVNKDALGFDTPRTAQRLIAVATNCDVDVVFDEAEAIRLNRIAWGNNVRGTEGTGENEWFTPERYIALAREVLGEIDLDPATHEQAQKIIRATRFYTKADDGLKQDWIGRVWLNPPYSQPLIGQFVAKLLMELNAGRTTAAVALTHNYTDAIWFHDAISEADAACFTQGRVKFYEPSGEIAKPTQGQTFFYYGSDVDMFKREFGRIGVIVRPEDRCVRRPR